jgi:hypothetical protein
MRAIKAGIDPKNIMNPGTLIPPIHKKDSPPTAATIDLQSINEWIVKPESLTAPVETNSNVSASENGDSFFGRSWGEMKKMGGDAAHAVGLIKSAPQSTKGTPGVWKEQGDGA